MNITVVANVDETVDVSREEVLKCLDLVTFVD